jgi:hypothetical protein
VRTGSVVSGCADISCEVSVKNDRAYWPLG